MNKVIVFRNLLLHHSETFIKEQVTSLLNWHPILVGEQVVHQGLDINNIETCLLASAHCNLIEKIIYKICRHFSIASPITTKKLRKIKPSLIHVHFGTSAIDISPYAKALNVPLLITLHGHDITVNKDWWKTQKKLRLRNYPDKLLNLSQNKDVHFIAVSEYIKQKAIRYGIPSEKIKVIYTGVNIQKFTPLQKNLFEYKNTVLFVGRLVEKKGVDVLIKACQILINEGKTFKLIIVGNGPLREELQKKASKIDCYFTGELTHEEVLALMQNASVLCLPSIPAKNGNTEGFGMVLIEAQSCGIPTISSASGGADEGIIDNKTGYKFEPGNHYELAKKINILLSNENLRKSFSISARNYVIENYDINKNTYLLEKYYESIVNAK